MNNPRFTKKYAWLAALTTATCWGGSCLIDGLASLAATFF